MGYNFTFLLINKQIDIDNHMAGKIFWKRDIFGNITKSVSHNVTQLK